MASIPQQNLHVLVASWPSWLSPLSGGEENHTVLTGTRSSMPGDKKLYCVCEKWRQCEVRKRSWIKWRYV